MANPNNIRPINIFLLMENSKIITAYDNEALAHQDCWLCNEAEKFSPDPSPYWVKPVEFVRADSAGT